MITSELSDIAPEVLFKYQTRIFSSVCNFAPGTDSFHLASFFTQYTL